MLTFPPRTELLHWGERGPVVAAHALVEMAAVNMLIRQAVTTAVNLGNGLKKAARWAGSILTADALLDAGADTFSMFQ